MSRVLLLDLDGTLLDHDGSSAVAITRLMADLGLWNGTEAELVAEWARLEQRWWGKFEAGEVDFQGQRRGRLRELLPEYAGLPDAKADEIFARYLAFYAENWHAYPDAQPCIQRARAAGWQLGVLTNGEKEQQWAKLVAIGCADADITLLASSELGAFKPEPAIFRAACQLMGCTPGDVLMVGDSYSSDVQGARLVGMKARHLARIGVSPDNDHIISLDDLTF